mgnify:CR=1 FL=1
MAKETEKAADTVAKTEFDAKAVELTKAQEEITKLKADVEKLTKAAEEAAKVKTAEPEDIWKGVNPAVKKEFEELKKQADENAKIAKAAEENAATVKLAKRVEQELGGLAGTVDEKTAMLRDVEKTLGSEKFEKLYTVIKSASEVIKKSQLLDELGSTGSSMARGGAFEKIKAKAQEIVKAGQAKTEAEAITKVVTENPTLYNEYIQEGVN